MVPNRQQKAQNKKGKSNGTSLGASSVIGAGSSSKISKKIRDIERLLYKRRDKLPANVIVENERALAALKVEKENLEYIQKVKKFSKKYHMIRFFEKKKALRKYKQVKAEHDELAANENSQKKDIKKLRKKLQHCEIDLAYVVNFPKDTKYISLYPNEESDEPADEDTKKGLVKTQEIRNEFKKQVEQMIKDSTLPVSIEDILAGKSSKKVTHKSDATEDAPDAPQDQEQDEEDDFFE